jgi:cell division protein FtsL
MRLCLLLFLTLFTVGQHSQPPSPTPTKAADANQKQPKPEQQQARNDEQASRDLTTAINQLTAEIAGQNQQQSAAPNKDETSAKWWSIGNTVLITIFTGILAWVAVLQWKAMHRQADIYDRQAGIADKQADIAAEQLELTKATEGRRDFEKTIEGFEKAREQKIVDERYSQQFSLAQENAVAAKQSADAALLNAQSITNAERAWILVEFDVDGKIPRQATIYCRAKNHGRTPAEISRCSVVYFPHTYGEEYPTEPEYQQTELA